MPLPSYLSENLLQPPNGFKKGKTEFERFVRAHPSIPDIMKNWNFYLHFREEVIDYISLVNQQSEFNLLIQLLSGKKTQDLNDQIIEFLENNPIKQFQNIPPNYAVTKFMYLVESIMNDHHIPQRPNPKVYQVES